MGELLKLSPAPISATPESQVLGMMPNEAELAQGPLTIAALGADPPDRSTHFHLSLMSLADGVLSQHQLELPPEEVDVVLARAKLLNTKSLTVVPGEGQDHGLVWEGLGDIGTQPPISIDGKEYLQNLPQGDNEAAFRRFIDDSVNILQGLELNERRVDEGLPPINILWPWGQGVRFRVPNLALRRAEPVKVYSPSLRLAGLSRLVGYRHSPRTLLAKGLNTDWRAIADIALTNNASLIWSPVFGELRQKNLIEEAGWLTKQIEESFLNPIFSSAAENPVRLSLLSPTDNGTGLAVTYETKMQNATMVPFDERALEERKLPITQMYEMIDHELGY